MHACIYFLLVWFIRFHLSIEFCIFKLISSLTPPVDMQSDMRTYSESDHYSIVFWVAYYELLDKLFWQDGEGLNLSCDLIDMITLHLSCDLIHN